MAQDALIDIRPHPLGIGFHPNWQAVRDRRAERECNLIQREAAEAQRQARRHKAASATAGRATRVFVMALQGTVCFGFVACFWWALA
ncbi:hypothetical protein [Brevundimonas sp. P7753]|uniref:hypothetical protein n=1 Tax=Brevundimonas sp. P7753 TaxID=2726982 RepID=UPI0015BEFD47|nr:hypothetical protein [Brevundimonas sp. P7753]NWE53673.1 hypothetical protein [Brevundimonas sp. P7753]